MGKIAVAALMVFLIAGQLFAQAGTKDLEKTVESAVKVRQDTQEAQDSWAKERADLLARYRTAKAQVEYLQERAAIEEQNSKALDERIQELERRMIQSDQLRSSLQDSLNSVLAGLETRVASDLPFLLNERESRIKLLKLELARPDLTGAEKLRMVLEALQIEASYGSTVEVNQEQIEVNGESMFVDVLRLGRVSVFWKTPDGLRIGEFDRATRRWIELSGSYKRNITAAMEMASRIRPVELITLPLGRIQP